MDDVIIKAVASSSSMLEAASKTGLHYQTFRKHAKRLGVWHPNQAGKGQRKPSRSEVPLQEILEGKHPSYGYGRLKQRLLREGVKKNECEECGISEWRGKKLTIQLDHRNGKRYDHRLENLRMLCPNCHSQTPTYCGGNASVAERHTHPA